MPLTFAIMHSPPFLIIAWLASVFFQWVDTEPRCLLKVSFPSILNAHSRSNCSLFIIAAGKPSAPTPAEQSNLYTSHVANKFLNCGLSLAKKLGGFSRQRSNVAQQPRHNVVQSLQGIWVAICSPNFHNKSQQPLVQQLWISYF